MMNKYKVTIETLTDKYLYLVNGDNMLEAEDEGLLAHELAGFHFNLTTDKVDIEKLFTK